MGGSTQPVPFWQEKRQGSAGSLRRSYIEQRREGPACSSRDVDLPKILRFRVWGLGCRVQGLGIYGHNGRSNGKRMIFEMDTGIRDVGTKTLLKLGTSRRKV